MHKFIRDHRSTFHLYKEATRSGTRRGAMLECKICARAVKMEWRKEGDYDTSEEAQKAYEAKRQKLRAFLACTAKGRAHTRIG